MLETIWDLLRDTALYLLIGFLVAGLLATVLDGSALVAALRVRGGRSVWLATLIGIPLPLCSCSVLPTAVALRRGGADRGATLAFLVSTPETSVTSILLTYGLLGPVMAIARPVAAAATALIAGFTENALGAPDPESDEVRSRARSRAAAGEDAAADVARSGDPAADAHDPPAASAHADCCDADADADPLAENANPRSLRAGLRFAFVDLFDDVFGWVVIGILFAAALQVFVPTDSLAFVFDAPLASMLLMVVIGVPLYVCAEASTPIAAALVAQGLSPGAALVLLLVGPATNIGAVGVLHALLGRRSVVVYLATIVVVAVVLGLALDAILGAGAVQLGTAGADEPFVPGALLDLGGVVFLALGVATLWRWRARRAVARPA